MDIFEEIEKLDKKEKPKIKEQERKISTQKSLSGVQTEEISIQLTKDAEGFYRVANPENISLTEEEVQKYSYVGDNKERMEREEEEYFTSNFLKKISIKMRTKLIAKYIKMAASCSDAKRQKLREKVIELLEKPIYSFEIAEAIAREAFCDNLGVYAAIHNAGNGIIAYAYKIAQKQPSQEGFDRILKYIPYYELNARREQSCNTLLSELSPRQYEIVLEILRRNGKTIAEYAYLDLQKEYVEKGIKMGVLAMRGAWLGRAKATTLYYGNSYFRKFCDEVDNAEKQYAFGESLQELERRMEKFDDNCEKEAEQKIDKLYNEALENCEEEKQI